MTQPFFSLFDTLTQQTGDSTPLVRLTKQTLVHLTETLEKFVRQDHVETLLFLGLQDTIYTRTNKRGLARLRAIAQRTCVFSGDPPDDLPDDVVYLHLQPGNPLRQEWFVILLADRFHVLLCSHERATHFTEPHNPEFDIIWTFSPPIIAQSVQQLMAVITATQPEQAEIVQHLVTQNTLTEPNSEWIVRFTAQLLYRINGLHSDLRQHQHTISTLLNSIQHGVYIVDVTPDGSFHTRYQSPQYETLFGKPYPPAGKIEDHFAVIHPEDRAWVVQARVEQPPEVSVPLEFRMRHAHGHELWVEDTVTKQIDPTRQMITIYGMVRDITAEVTLREQDRVRERLRLMVEKEREVNAIKTYFMTNISHEFRTPLAIILSASQLMERYWDRLTEDDRAARFAQIHQQVMHLSNILNDITTILHGNLEHLGFHPETHEVEPFLRDLVLQTTKQTTARTFAESYGDDLGTAELDPKLFRHIVNNLLSNAVKFSHTGGEISISAYRLDDKLWLCVEDAGIGIPANELNHIFDVFHRAQNAINYGGTGLGLYIAQTCAHLHGGEITVTSEVGKGSIFKLQIPLYRAN